MVIDSEPTLPSTPPRTRQSEAASFFNSLGMMLIPGSWPGSQNNNDNNNDGTSNPNGVALSTPKPGGSLLSRLNPFQRANQLAAQSGSNLFRRPPVRPPLFRLPPSADGVNPTTPSEGPNSPHLVPVPPVIPTPIVIPSSPPEEMFTPSRIPPRTITRSIRGSFRRPVRGLDPPPRPPTWSARPIPFPIAPGAPTHPNIISLLTDESISLPGDPSTNPLSPNEKKVSEVSDEGEERLRLIERLRILEEQEREAKLEKERRRAAAKLAKAAEDARLAELNALGLRKPNAPLITPLSRNWDQKARRTPDNGSVNVPGPEGTDVSSFDFAKMVPDTAWLNDNIIQAVLASLSRAINDAAGVTIKKNTPKCVCLSPLFWVWLCKNGANGSERRFKRTWGVTRENFLDVDTFLFPINHGNHWTVVIIRPTRRTISYVDSFQSAGRRHLTIAYDFVRDFLGDKYDANSWSTVTYRVPSQTNSWDCGMFVITNCIYIALGLDPNNYSQDEMPLMRRRMAAMLLNGGFTGDFDIRSL